MDSMNIMSRVIIKIVALLVLVILVLFRSEIGDGIACLAYSDQCMAERVTGLSREECIARPDSVALLYEGHVCLVNP